jgi:hypothetical protein
VVRLGAAQPDPRLGGVVEAQHLPGPHGRPDGHQHARVDLRRTADRSDRRHLDRVHPAAEPVGHHLADGRQRPQRGLLDAGHGGRRGLQRDGDGHGLLVVEQQRRHPAARVEPVPAVRAHDRAHRVAQFAQPVDVAADGARADPQPLGQQRARPVPPGLQQRQQGEQPGGGLEHVRSLAGVPDRR